MTQASMWTCRRSGRRPRRRGGRPARARPRSSCVERDGGRGDVLLEVARRRFVPGIGDDVVALREHPGQRELAGRAALARRRARARASTRREVGLEGLALEAREVPPARSRPAPASLGSVMAPVRKPRPSGEYGTRPMPSSRQRRQDLVLEVAGAQRVLGLQRGDRVHGVRAADGRGRRLGEPEVADLAGLDELRHGADGLLDRHASGRRGAGSRGRCGRRRGAAARRRRRSGRSPGRPLMPSRLPSSSRSLPNLVASCTSSRRPAIARPTSRSLVNGPVHVGGVEEASRRGRARGGWWRWPAARRRCRRTPTCPCSRGRGWRRSAVRRPCPRVRVPRSADVGMVW